MPESESENENKVNDGDMVNTSSSVKAEISTLIEQGIVEAK
jgi:hypothetical protein